MDDAEDWTPPVKNRKKKKIILHSNVVFYGTVSEKVDFQHLNKKLWACLVIRILLGTE